MLLSRFYYEWVSNSTVSHTFFDIVFCCGHRCSADTVNWHILLEWASHLLLKYKFAAQRKGKRRVSELTTIYIYILCLQRRMRICVILRVFLLSRMSLLIIGIHPVCIWIRFLLYSLTKYSAVLMVWHCVKSKKHRVLSLWLSCKDKFRFNF